MTFRAIAIGTFFVSSLAWVPLHRPMASQRHLQIRTQASTPILDNACTILPSEEVLEIMTTEITEEYAQACLDGMILGDMTWWQTVGAKLPWGSPIFQYNSKMNTIEASLMDSESGEMRRFSWPWNDSFSGLYEHALLCNDE
eukprot:CAMPEP_0185770726 /NCGR_PEP_ID=MMETSP1174-20130828/60780_1 /TAXON_ID=35687 /ORGANISM="Dictyocha speculum, Strain CCMP1381" /LENGTH=141 /DNA_ID=CAMNT_0028456283 /DNA_START=32 /DNA_END=457 /DNA_ORIENTATION=-